jgi:hypothetical protein
MTISDEAYRRMKAQVNNDAHGWNSPAFAPYAESEPPDIDAIKGNFTHDDNEHSAALGYKLTVPISMANDYNGYIASYREFQRGDHYRKALTGWGPHSSDYMATRLVKLGRMMKNPELGLDETIRGAPTPDGIADIDADAAPFLAKTEADVAQNDVRAAALGEAADKYVTAYEASLPPDGGDKAAPTREPVDVQRFDLASFEWLGGSNYTDNPNVRVQRRSGDRWVDAADMTGEVVTTIKWPESPDALASYRKGGMEWRWTAHFEPFVSRFDMPGSPRATPPGVYRFVVAGKRREGSSPPATVDYELKSREFRVGPWAGVTVEDVRREADGRVSFRVGPRRSGVTHFDQSESPKSPIAVPTELGPIDYPDSYDKSRPEAAEFITETRRYSRDPNAPGDPARFELYCIECSFRPWADVGDAAKAIVTFAGPGRTRQVEARRDGDRWVTVEALRTNESGYVCPGDVQDAWGDFNGTLSAPAGAREVALRCGATPPIVGTTPITTGTKPPATGDAGRDGPGGVGPGETGTSPELGLPSVAPARSASSAAPRRAARRCRRARSLRLRLRAPRAGLRIRRAVVRVNGRRVRVARGRAARQAFRVRLRRGRTVVTVRMRASDGRTYVIRRTYRRCAAKR